MSESFEQLWAAQSAIGRDPESRGYRRGGWTPDERAATDWFRDQCADRDLTVESDGIGNLIAWWDPSPTSGRPAGDPSTSRRPVSPSGTGAFDSAFPGGAEGGERVQGAGGAYGPGSPATGDRSAPSPASTGDRAAVPRGTTGDWPPATTGDWAAVPPGSTWRGSAFQHAASVEGVSSGGVPGRAGVVTGSHLDSVIDGGAFDGPLGVVSALVAVDRLRAEGFVPSVPIGVGAFVEEEGSRFGMPCLGSRVAAGVLAPERALGLKDRAGVGLREALERAGTDPAGVGPSPFLERMGVFVELHVEQGRALSVPVGVASSIWPHGRYRFTFTGEANHAGTTLMEDRHDPMLTYAMTALAANKQARLAGARATFGRVSVEPNGTNAIPSRVTAWLDARAASTEVLEKLLEAITRLAVERAERDGTAVEVVAESVSPIVEFQPALRDRLAGVLDDAPILPTGAGHDAGVFSDAGIPTAMLFVRNPTGISHSPEEHAELDDCLAGVDALTKVLKELAG